MGVGRPPPLSSPLPPSLPLSHLSKILSLSFIPLPNRRPCLTLCLPSSAYTHQSTCRFNSGSSILFHLSLYHAVFFYHDCAVIQLEVRDGDSPQSSFIVEDSFHYTVFLVIPNEFANCSRVFDFTRILGIVTITTGGRCWECELSSQQRVTRV